MISKQTICANVRVLLYAVPVVAAALVIKSDAGSDAGILVDGLKFGEDSKTEMMQQFFLLVTSVTFFLAGAFSKSHKAIAYLFGGGVLAALIRELDAYFDQIYHGAWFPCAMLVAGLTVFLVWRQKKQIWENLEEFYSTPAFGIILSGFLSVFIFSRIFGSKKVWLTLFEVENLSTTQRWVKNATEEGSELFGYTLLLIAAAEFFTYVVQPLRLVENAGEDLGDRNWLAHQLTPRQRSSERSGSKAPEQQGSENETELVI